MKSNDLSLSNQPDDKVRKCCAALFLNLSCVDNKEELVACPCPPNSLENKDKNKGSSVLLTFLDSTYLDL